MIGMIIAVFCAIVCEYTYRILKLGSFSMPVETWIVDDDLIYALNPEAPDSPKSFREKTPGSDKDASVRAICMGGSTTYGHGVFANEAWPSVVEKVLQSQGIHAEVINAGVPGYGTRQQVIRYQRDIVPAKPDIVILFLGWNGTGALLNPSGCVPGSVARPGASQIRRLWIAIARHSLIFQDLVDATRTVRVQVFEGGYQYNIENQMDVFVADTKTLVREILAHNQTPLLVIHASMYYSGITRDELLLVEPKIWNKLPYDPVLLKELDRRQTVLRTIAREPTYRWLILRIACVHFVGRSGWTCSSTKCILASGETMSSASALATP